MIKTGLTSVTFRQLETGRIIGLAVEAGLAGIEWGGDIHAPAGDEARATRLREETEAAGLRVCSYGSYFRPLSDKDDFAPVLATAKALGAPVIRAWAGPCGSEKATPEVRRKVAESLREALEAAATEGLTLALEYHANTLTDTLDSAMQLVGEVGHPELKLYWQTRNGAALESDLKELEAVFPRLSHLHVFHWKVPPEGGIDRRLLDEGREDWKQILALAARAGGDRFAIMEFVRDDDPANFLADARVLKELIAETEN